MKKRTKLTFGIFVCILSGVIFFSIKKESPRVYLNNRINLAYINESINKDNFNEVYSFLGAINIPVDENLKKVAKHLKGLYIISDSKFVSKRKKIVGILNFGYCYPLFYLNSSKYFEKVGNYYKLKKEFQNKYCNGEELYLKEENGNFLIAKRKNDIEEILDEEKYIEPNFSKIISRNAKNNLGMIVANLEKNPLGGFNEFVLTGNINKKNIIFKTVIGGENDIIKSFSEIKNDGLSGEKELARNRLYLRTSKENELRSFFFFLNYLFRNRIFDDVFSKVHINRYLDSVRNEKESFIKTKVLDNQFLYGDVDIKLSQEQEGINLELKGISSNNKLIIQGSMDKNQVINILNRE